MVMQILQKALNMTVMQAHHPTSVTMPIQLKQTVRKIIRIIRDTIPAMKVNQQAMDGTQGNMRFHVKIWVTEGRESIMMTDTTPWLIQTDM